ncbi:hypothetical protein CAC42_3095 [Sphaceloma murrayae]|uniref:RING-type domain-containing protein n=1 Tax=Sphaceloma murrayae TaxID=2082308 RepID=A0A2K1QRY6_9PEZI|nr:hypothetical protein CAC42_3095 [Sphaceloma murrayae]
MASTSLNAEVTSSEHVAGKVSHVSPDGEHLWNFFRKHTGSHSDEPPRKRVKLEDDTSEDGTKHSGIASIPIGRVTLSLVDPAHTGRPLPLDLHHSDAVDVFIVGLEETEVQHATLKLASTTSKGLKTELGIRVRHDHSPSEIRDLMRVSQLQRRSRGNSKSPVAYAESKLICTSSGLDASAGFRLECTIFWPDGAAAPADTSQLSVDRLVLSRYYDVPSFNANKIGRRRPSNEEMVAPQDFYDAVYVTKPDARLSDQLGSYKLQTQLYPFQKRAVAWMLQREGSDLVEQALPMQPSDLSYRPVKDTDGRSCFVSNLEGVVITERSLQQRKDVRGGILSEEMGLGKTCELLALICMNTRSPSATSSTALTRTGATLVVTPHTILQQWKDEINRHAPHLSWTHYEGMLSINRSSHSSQRNKKSEQSLIDTFAGSDIVLVTYHVLAGEIHYAVDPPERSLRKPRDQKDRPRSPLVQMDWWRVCLDEAQMVESGVSKAAQTASLIPRHNAWAVSGTPVKKDVQDLRGLLIFLGYEPFAGSTGIWKRLVTHHRIFEGEFKKLFGRIALRHTKDKIRGELRLPPQRRVVVTMPFTTIEEQNYQNLFEEMADECGLNVDGSPASGLWDPDDARVISRMREWLVRLRQTCLHPQVGSRNQRALGKSNGPLRTVEEVLAIMIDQNESAIVTEARMAVVTLCLKGHITSNARELQDRAERALVYYLPALERAKEMVGEARAEVAKLPAPEMYEASSSSDNEEESPEQKKRGRLRNHLRNVLELQHMCEFFIGTAYYQMKSADGVEENSDRWAELEKLEVQHYDEAKIVRREILRETAQRAEKVMNDVRANSTRPIDLALPSMTNFDSYGGIESQRVLEKVDHLSGILTRQTRYLAEWRSQVIELLLKQLVDVEDSEVTGEEYEDSTKQQEEMYAYFDAYRAVVSDRATCISGQINTLVNHEMGTLYKDSLRQDELDVEEGREAHESRQLFRSLLDQRNAIKQKDNGLISLRGLSHEIRSIESNLEWADNPRSRGELSQIKGLMSHIQSMADAYNKLQSQLEKDQELFRTAMNQRLEFYRQLQQLSDTVSPWREEMDDTLDQIEYRAAEYKLTKHERTLSTLRSKRRFLLHLREQSTNDCERICVICQQGFEQGVLTICGHQFCKDCINLWYREHHNCPVCKRSLRKSDFHNITYRPQDLKAHEETTALDSPEGESSSSSASTPDPSATRIYSNISTSDLTAIKSIDLPSSRSFGTKIDTIARHLLHIRRTSPGTKTLIFSQYRDFLSVLSSALTTFSISHVSISAPNSTTRFRENASIEAFLLDAKTDSSGLNLVNATNVMLCEPLVNPGIELQAIARVHRIGQTRATNVFMYLVSGTVEESVYEVSVKRRLELMHRSRDGVGSRSATPGEGGEVDKAERLEMQKGLGGLLGKGQAGGETVRAEDLWRCLFGAGRRGKVGLLDDGVEGFVSGEQGGAGREEVGRFVRGEAALQRL